jgi:molybdopterin converting factor small subunit
MAVKLEIPTALRPFAGKQASVEFNAATVGDALKQLTGIYADLRKHLYTDDGRIRSFVNIYVNDEDIRYLQKENTPIKDGDTISIVPSIAGGVNL